MTVALLARGQTALEVTTSGGDTYLLTSPGSHRTDLVVTGGAPGRPGDRGQRGPAGASTGYGWVDFSDLDLGTPLVLLPGIPTQVTRNLAGTGVNNKLAGPFETHVFWSGNRIRPRAAGDVLRMSLMCEVSPGLVGGMLTMSVDVGGAVGAIVETAQPYPCQPGETARMRFELITPVRAAFLANGGRVILNSSVPAELLQFSPEFYPQSVVGAVE